VFSDILCVQTVNSSAVEAGEIRSSKIKNCYCLCREGFCAGLIGSGTNQKHSLEFEALLSCFR